MQSTLDHICREKPFLQMAMLIGTIQ